MKNENNIIPEQLQDPEFRFTKVKKKSKKAFEEGWNKNPENNYQYDSEELQKHIRRGGNYGVLVGRNNLIVIDSDSKLMEKIVEKNLPDTFKVRTGGGGAHHYYFCQTHTLNEKEYKLNNGENHMGELEIKKVQVMGPNSTHPTGNKYKIENNQEITKISEEELKRSLSAFLDINTIKNKKSRPKIEIDEDIPLRKIINSEKWKDDGKNWRRYCPHFQGSHSDNPEEAESIWGFVLDPENYQWFCHYHNVGGGLTTLFPVLKDKLTCEEIKNNQIPISKLEEYKKDLNDKFDLNLKINSWKKVKDLYQKSNNNQDITKKYCREKAKNLIIDKYNIITNLNSGQIWLFEDGCYKQNGEKKLKTLLDENLSEHMTIREKREIIDKVRSATQQRMKDLDKGKRFIPLKNGWFDLEDWELKNPDPSYFITTKLPVKYDPKADCPKFKKFVDDVVEGNNTEILKEILGFIIFRGYPIDKAIMLYGEGANGKSTYIKLIEKFIGTENVVENSLHRLSSNRFAKAELQGKLLNISPDIPGKTLKDTSIFKMLVGGDTLQAERKRKDPFTFKNYAKLIYSSNNLPSTEDTADAFFRRWILIPFPYKFTNTDDEHKDRDEHIVKKIISEKEKSGMLNLALEKLKKLEEPGFTKTKITKNIKQEWLIRSDPLRVFVEKKVGKNKDNYVTKERFYNSYVNFCLRNDVPPKRKSRVSRLLPTMIPTKEATPDINGKRKKAWKHIKLKDETVLEFNQDIKEFVGKDDNTYGPFNEGEQLELSRLPDSEIKFLIENNYVKKIKTEV